MTRWPEHGLMSIDWRENDLLTLTSQLEHAHDSLSTELMADIQPQDLVIGGLAVHNAIRREGAGYYAGALPQAKLTLERWAVAEAGDVTIRVAKSVLDDSGIYDGLLARQLEGAYRWLPYVERQRTARIAKLAGEATTLEVSFFYGRGTPGDTDFEAMRTAIDSNIKGEEYNQTIKTNKRTIGRIDKERIRSLALQAGPTAEAVRQAGQRRVDNRVRNIRDKTALCNTALEIIVDGQRIRPSQPQHG